MLMEKELPDEDKSIRDRVLGERKTSFQARELKVDAATKDEKEGAANGLQGTGNLQVQQQQPQGTGVCWERFLHVRSVRVLLVEDDDSTRHVVTALLRNCNYEVIEAANGLQAWKILEDLTIHIDIVLTEVVMPCLSGIALLCKIMSHKTRKTIPVIMMSSHDSMGLAFKCFSKGAVDFLVKPIRKNELKNLWQHVWRRCHSSSGSGSESATQTQKSVKSNRSEKADNSGSDDGENNGSNGLNAGDGSDDGSGTQSSWTKQAVKVYSSQAMSPIDQVAVSPDSTCAQVIRPNVENSGNKRVDKSVAREGHEQSQPDTVAQGKDLETIISRSVESKPEDLMEILVTPMGAKLKSLSELDCNMSTKQIDKAQLNPTGECLFNKHKGASAKMSIPLIDGKESESAREGTSVLDINNSKTDDAKEPNFEHSLKRLRGVQDTGRSVQDDRCVLRRSEQSAFSRYNTSSNVSKHPNGVKGSVSIIDNSVEVAKGDSVGDIQAHSTERLVYHSWNGVSNNIDMGSTTNKLCGYPSIMKDKSEATSTVDGLHPSALRPMKNDSRYSQPQVNLLVSNDIQTKDLAPAGGSHQEQLQAQHPHCHNYYHRHYHHFRNLENQQSCNQDESSLEKLAADARQCGSSNVLSGQMDNNPRNSSLNRSASGSNFGSNGNNGSSNAINAVGTNTESDFGRAGKSGSGDASGSGSGTGVDENRLTQREAALKKFRQKRKERCFKKKVRYQNRKKLAEQRPRVRGQFVKQTGSESSSRTADE